eukprot:8285463-Pyramimonas_sp.AAC.1
MRRGTEECEAADDVAKEAPSQPTPGRGTHATWGAHLRANKGTLRHTSKHSSRNIQWGASAGS